MAFDRQADRQADRQTCDFSLCLSVVSGTDLHGAQSRTGYIAPNRSIKRTLLNDLSSSSDASHACPTIISSSMDSDQTLVFWTIHNTVDGVEIQTSAATRKYEACCPYRRAVLTLSRKQVSLARLFDSGGRGKLRCGADFDTCRPNVLLHC